MKMARSTVAVRCKVCRFKVRGPNHEKGEHHLKALRRIRATTTAADK